jgi:hypothetical protein
MSIVSHYISLYLIISHYISLHHYISSYMIIRKNMLLYYNVLCFHYYCYTLFIFHYIFSPIIIYYHILSYIITYHHILSYIITYYHILSHIIIILLNIIRYSWIIMYYISWWSLILVEFLGLVPAITRICGRLFWWPPLGQLAPWCSVEARDDHVFFDFFWPKNLVNIQKAIENGYWKWLLIVSFSIENGDFP